LISVVSLGTIGYSLIEKWSLFDSLYMTIITLTTVGFEEIQTLTRAGRIFTTVFAATGGWER
jgi:voltage-gated potassium channel